MQRAQAVVLNLLTDSNQFGKIKVSDKAKDNKGRAPVNQATKQQPCRSCGGVNQPRQCPVYRKMCTEFGKVDNFRKVCHSRRSRMVNDMEPEASQEYREEEI